MSEVKRDDLPPHLAVLSDKELEGLRKRAEREGVPIEQLKLRESRRPGMPALTPAQQTRRGVNGILVRMEREGKSLRELPVRETDDPWVLADAMAEICLRREGCYVKSTGDGRPTGRLTAEEREILDDENVGDE